jgi:coatomer protein complex subunit alpha (xenin)
MPRRASLHYRCTDFARSSCLTHPAHLLQVRILEESGQLPLAYVAAATHGLEEDAERLGAMLPELPEVPSAAHLLLPATPILKEDNWPLLTVSKGFFENLAAKVGRQAGSGAASVAALEGPFLM